ncbi:Uncharacterized protein HZ326_9254 [Fusarium oxysporum f. sp. albedinis]|nr:Uncharacterized protein HZ326_9254 [Fusarium oxysporum f. sp. albedinis]
MTRARWSLRCLTAVPGSVLPSRKITARNPAWVASKLLETLSQTTDTEKNYIFACDSAILLAIDAGRPTRLQFSHDNRCMFSAD